MALFQMMKYRVGCQGVTQYRTQKRIQRESIHSVILDVYVLKAELQNSPFL